MPTAHVNGTHLAYVEQGRGEPLVLVHGSLGDFRSWRAQIEPFSKHYRVVAYSRRYHYPNAWPGDGLDYSAALHAQDLAALIQDLGPGPAHVAAASYGAYISLLLAARFPELVRTLVLGEPPIMPWLEHIPGGPPLLADFLAEAWGPARRALQRGDLKGGVGAFLDGVTGVEGGFDQLPPAAQAKLMDNALTMHVEASARDYFPSFTCDEARGIGVPTLLLTGERSPRMFHLITDELERCLSDTERVTIPGASHGIHTDNPGGYNEAVLAFLSQRK